LGGRGSCRAAEWAWILMEFKMWSCNELEKHPDNVKNPQLILATHLHATSLCSSEDVAREPANEEPP
ncbi:MAG TPA: hypothetical protein PJ991_09890, partial [Kiritimatiellia bacterium]|nr:hypothetical protein [Kiritimatiellia bacterium]